MLEVSWEGECTAGGGCGTVGMVGVKDSAFKKPVCSAIEPHHQFYSHSLILSNKKHFYHPKSLSCALTVKGTPHLLQ